MEGKYITINRTVRGTTDRSTLVMERGKLVVMGNLPHNAEITMDAVNAQKLLQWLYSNTFPEGKEN